MFSQQAMFMHVVIIPEQKENIVISADFAAQKVTIAY